MSRPPLGSLTCPATRMEVLATQEASHSGLLEPRRSSTVRKVPVVLSRVIPYFVMLLPELPRTIHRPKSLRRHLAARNRPALTSECVHN
jgi:hypothetical protein